MAERCSSILDRIGNTPLVKLSTPKGSATLWGKLESANPGGSVKDRIAKAMIEQAEKDGLLKLQPDEKSGGYTVSLVEYDV